MPTPSVIFWRVSSGMRHQSAPPVGRQPANKIANEKRTRVASLLRGLSETKRERLTLKGFPRYSPQHGINENKTRIALKSLAIPAGFEPATHGVEIRYSIQLSYGTVGVFLALPI